MPEAVRWGVLGNARIARNFVVPAIRSARGADLVAWATGSVDGREALQSHYPGLRIHDGYQALLDDRDVDAVYIPLPNHLHVEWTERALRAGKAVLCEKPIALAAASIDRLMEVRDKTGHPAAEAFMVVHHPQWQRARALVAEGAIGRLLHVEGCFTYRNTDLNNIRNRRETGGGGLLDIGVYPCITARFVTGQEPTVERAEIAWENGVDVFARVWARFEEATFSFYCGMRQAPRQEMVFHGEEGWLRLVAPFNARSYGDCRLDVRGVDGSIRSEQFNGIDQYALMIEAFGRTLREGEPFACPLEFSRGNQETIDRIYAAALPRPAEAGVKGRPPEQPGSEPRRPM